MVIELTSGHTQKRILTAQQLQLVLLILLRPCCIHKVVADRGVCF